MNAAAPAPGARARTYRVEVLGCKVNQCEARQAERILDDAGLRPAAPGEAADVSVVHSCAVTAEALRQSLQRLRRAARAGGRAVLSGCGAAADAAAAGHLPGAAAVPAGPDWAAAFARAAREWAGATVARCRRPAPGPAGAPARAFLKIQDGCDRRCAYCIVPRLRGPSRDRPADEVIAEAARLAAAGHREIVVTGVHAGLYGGDGARAALPRLLERLAATPGLERIRMSSLHPAELTPELLRAWADAPAIAPHVHLPLQSGSDRVLRRMRRGYTADGFRAAVARARAALDRPSFTTDVIAGFPGETDDDFEATLALCREIGFGRVHVFPFSPRPGTAAAAMEGQATSEAIRRRARRARQVAAKLAEAFHRAAVGQNVRVLCETRDPATGEWSGYGERYVPVRFAGPAGLEGRVVPVRLTSSDARGAHGEAAGGE
jgi:threonylcarbamoyladenosine tRNA methylthiotransferase MtaB